MRSKIYSICTVCASHLPTSIYSNNPAPAIAAATPTPPRACRRLLNPIDGAAVCAGAPLLAAAPVLARAVELTAPDADDPELLAAVLAVGLALALSFSKPAVMVTGIGDPISSWSRLDEIVDVGAPLSSATVPISVHAVGVPALAAQWIDRLIRGRLYARSYTH